MTPGEGTASGVGAGVGAYGRAMYNSWCSRASTRRSATPCLITAVSGWPSSLGQSWGRQLVGLRCCIRRGRGQGEMRMLGMCSWRYSRAKVALGIFYLAPRSMMYNASWGRCKSISNRAMFFVDLDIFFLLDLSLALPQYLFFRGEGAQPVIVNFWKTNFSYNLHI